jgi:non-specific serine/threonine protein kinase
LNPERWQQVKEVFEAMLERAPAERAALLDRACAGDEAVRREVESLLASYTDDFMETPASAAAARELLGGPGELPAGEHFGRFEVLSLVGEGGMGEVYLAHDPTLGRNVALKLLPSHYTNEADRVRRFEREARAASMLNHPNILTIHEIGQVDGRHFIATEFVEGETLRRTLEREGMLPFTEALDVCAQLASALAAAHEAGVVHRDIKPENVMVRRDKLVKVLDFGLAKLAENKEGEGARQGAPARFSVKTNPGVVMGTATYMSPEQARGLEVDARTDIFSLGVVLYEMLAGRVPFEGETTSDVIAAILTAEPAPPGRLDREVPVALERIVNRALAKGRAERYQTATELLADLRRLKQRFEFEAEVGQGLEAGTSPTQTLVSAPEVSGKNLATESGASGSSLPPHNLSKHITPLIGREQEMAEATSLLRRDDVRLVTMTGVGGTGKTLLARWIARGLRASYKDGVFLVELAALTNAELVVSTIAQALGVTETGGKPIIERLKEHLCERELLLVLDNFEQVIEAAPRMAELLAAAPRVQILVTSRALLHLSMEREVVIPPLDVPTDAASALDELQAFEAVRLFVERARSAKPNFALTDENAGSVVEICARLDGLPLAIELAAARVRVLSPRAILSKLENRLQLLTGGARDLPARQQTMRGAIEWSYDLLTADEKRLFRRLGVFTGGFTLEAAETVAGGRWPVAVEEKISHPATEVLDLVMSLADKSLLAQKERADGSARFRMLEVVREYALDALTLSGESEAARRNHAAYFLALGEEAEPHLQAGQSSEWLDRLEEEHDNLRAAMHWALEQEVATAARLAGAIRTFWTVHGHLTEGSGRLRAALERAGRGVPLGVRFKLLNGLGPLARLQGDYETAREVYEAGLAEGRAANDLRQVALASWGLGAVAEQQGDITAARKYIEDGLAISRELDDKFGIAASLSFLGDLARTEGEPAAARPLFEESLALFRQLGNQRAVSNNLNNLGALACGAGDYQRARLRFAEALATAQKLGHKITISYSLDGFAALAAGRGEEERAARLAGAAERLRESIGSEMEPAERRFREAYLGGLRAALSDSAFRSAYEQGRKLKLEEAVAVALDDSASAH